MCLQNHDNSACLPDSAVNAQEAFWCPIHVKNLCFYNISWEKGKSNEFCNENKFTSLQYPSSKSIEWKKFVDIDCLNFNGDIS